MEVYYIGPVSLPPPPFHSPDPYWPADSIGPTMDVDEKVQEKKKHNTKITFELGKLLASFLYAFSRTAPKERVLETKQEPDKTKADTCLYSVQYK